MQRSRTFPEGAEAGPVPPPSSKDQLPHRAVVGILAIGLFLVGQAAVSQLRLPNWLAILFPLPSTVVAALALAPGAWIARLQRTLSPRVSALVSLGLIAISASIGMTAIGSPPGRWDQPLTMVCASRDLIAGTDPYGTFEPQCEAALHYHGTAATPLESGPFRTLHQYPASNEVRTVMIADQLGHSHLGFPAFGYPPLAAVLLVPVAFQSWTIIDLWVAWVCILLLSLMSWGAPRPGLLVIAWQLAGLAMTWHAFGWNPEEISYLFLTLSFAQVHRIRLSALALAAAVLSNPISWLVAPIYVAATYHAEAWGKRLTWLTASTAAVLIAWTLWDPQLPVQMVRFVTLPEFPIGAALATLVPLPSSLHPWFMAFFLAVIASLTGVAWRFSEWRWSMVAFVFLAFFVSWRGPVYYYLAPLWLAPAVALGAARLQSRVVAVSVAVSAA